MGKITYRDYNKLVDLSKANLTPRQAILLKCKECSAFQDGEVRYCNCKTCALWEISRKYLSKTSRQKKTLTTEQLELARERIRIAREKRLSNEV